MQAKGHEAEVVYVVGLKEVARHDAHLPLRSQLFVGISRSRGCLGLAYLQLRHCAVAELLEF